MASNTQPKRFPLRSSQTIKALICLFMLSITAFLPYRVSAATPSGAVPLPDLTNFSSTIQNGDSKDLRGAYLDGLFALPILQQPISNPGYVSTVDNTLTQFDMVSQYGNVGLLAHNYLSGQYFSKLMLGMRMELVYGDGHIEIYQVSQVYRYQAVTPNNDTSGFIDLDTHATLTAGELFTKVYTGTRHVTFQTCISQGGNTSWGRLFVIAEPDQSGKADGQKN
jgi:hypothetical protein